MKLLDLQNDQWANIRAAYEVPEGLRRVANKAAFALDRSRPDEVMRALLESKASVTITQDPEPDLEARAAFGAPPVEALIEEAKVEYKRDTVEFPLSDDELDAMDAYVAARVLAYVESWSFGNEVSDQTILTLPGGAYDAIGAAIEADYGADKVAEVNENELDPTRP